MLEFGNEEMEWDCDYPDSATNTMVKVSPDHYNRLLTIRYRQQGDEAELSGIRLKFTDGTQSPWFEDSEGGRDIHVIEIDPEKTITSISMRVCQGSYLHGLRMEDADGGYVVDCSWSKDPLGSWVTHPVPAGEHIIGIKCH